MAHLLHIEEELRIALNSKFENKIEGQAILIHHASSGFQMTGILGQANDYLHRDVLGTFVSKSISGNGCKARGL